MTYEQFWNGDVELAKYYREAWRLKRQERNRDLWLQGAYIYEAILDVSPILNPFAQKGTRPDPYREQPYEIYAKKGTKQNTRTKEQIAIENARSSMEVFMVNFNQRFKEKGGGDHGD